MTTTFLFPDLETTGTKTGDDLVLEAAWAFTDEDFRVVGTPKTFLVKPETHEWAQIAQRLGENAFVLRMHRETGLWDDLPTAEFDLFDVRRELENDIADIFRERPGQIHIAGLSVEFDVRFLEDVAGMDFDKLGVHHRLLNLSSLKLAYENAGAAFQRATNNGAHRALNDVFEAIEQARLFQQSLKQLPAF